MEDGYRKYLDKSFEFIYQEELRYNNPYIAQRNAKRRQRMYANLFCRDMRKKFILPDSKCCSCGSTENLHIDHIIPVAKGGINSETNVQILCQSCNLKKNARI